MYQHLLYSIFKNLKQLGYGNLPFSNRYTLAKDLIQRHYESPTKWTTRVFLLILYFGSLLGGIAGGLQAIVPGWVSFLPDYFESPQQRLERVTKDRQREVERATAALRLNPNDINTYRSRAQMRNMLEDYKGAINDYSQIIRLNAKDTWAYLERGYARQQLRDYFGAIADANYAIELDPNQPDAYLLRSEVRRNLGDEQGAIADEQKAEALYKALKEEDPS